MNKQKIVKRKKIFPTSTKNIGEHIKNIHLHYVLDNSVDPETIVMDASSDIKLMCKRHDNFKFTSKWRYLRSNANGNSGHCKVCLAEKGAANIKIKYLVDQEMQKHSEHPAKIIDKRYSQYSRIKSHEPIEVECLKCGDIHPVSINNFFFEGSHQCKECTKIYREKHGHPNKKITVDSVNKELQIHGFKLMDKKQNVYKDMNTLECPKGHHFDLCYTSLKEKLERMQSTQYELEQICTRCRDLVTYNKHKAMIEEKGFLIRESFDEYEGVHKEYTFICKNNSDHIRQKSFVEFEKITSCKACKDQQRIEKNYKNLLEEVEKRGGKIKNNKPLKTKKEKVTCICHEGHEFKVSHQKINTGQWCPECATGFEERLCRLLMEHIFQVKFNKVRPSFMPSPDSDENLELDGYNEGLGVAFEYNGKYWHASKKAKERDALKIKYTKAQGIKLVVVNQFKHYRVKELLKYIDNLCKKQDIKVPNYSGIVDISSAYEGTTNKIVLERIVKEKGGKYIKGSKYLGLDEKIKFKCKKPTHPIFEHSL